MNTALLKTFGQKARTLLIDGVTRKLQFWGFDKDGKVLEQPERLPGGYKFRENIYDDATVPGLWQKLSNQVASEGIKEIAERAAYIWFNRLMALQILGKNGYEQTLLAPISTEEQTPIIVKNARSGQYDFLNKSEQLRLQKILTDYEKETQLFGILLIGFCHSSNLLNKVFGGIEDYTELLLPDDILSPGGFLDLLNNGDYITDNDYQQVELIGWLYQFYISEKKDEVFKSFKAGKKAEAKDIPAATQIFTPNWIVKYMVENTVGRIWLDRHPDSLIKDQMLYLVEAAGGHENDEPIIDEIKELKLLDPAVGSGHILVEGFDLLYRMYLEEYYPADEAVERILQNNLFGLDIDLRACQLAQFAVLIKAAQYYPDILKKGILPHIYAMPAPVYFTKEDIQYFLGAEGKEYIDQIMNALHLMSQAQNLGSIMQFTIGHQAAIFVKAQLLKWELQKDLDLMQQELITKLTPNLQVLFLLTQQYEAVCANPPYMGQANMNSVLKSYISSNLQNAKSDLMTVFMKVAISLLIDRGKVGMINLPSWMFLSSYESLRQELVNDYYFSSLIHLGRGVFGSDFGTVTFILEKSKSNRRKGIYRRLFIEHVKVDSVEIKEERFLNKKFGFFEILQDDFVKIAGTPIAYWVSRNHLKVFEDSKKIKDVSIPKFGMSVGDGNLFLRNWSEVSCKRILFEAESTTEYFNNKKWAPIDKGGEFRRWYGNQEIIVNWENDGREIKNHLKSAVRSPQFFLKPHNSWTLVTAGKFSSRYFPRGFILDTASNCLYFKDSKLRLYLLGLLNSKVASTFLDFINPTINYSCGVVGLVPLIEKKLEEVNQLVSTCINISKNDWDSRENSWNFTQSPLLIQKERTLKKSFESWVNIESRNFFLLHNCEEELNQIFIEIYGLSTEMNKIIPLKNVSVLTEELNYNDLGLRDISDHSTNLPIFKDRVIQQLVSYAIGCFMGRYRLDMKGLQIAHPDALIEELKPYNFQSDVTHQIHTFEIDEDAIIPIMCNKSNFSDDVFNRLRDFFKIIWGEERLTENINFVQDCLAQDLEEYLVKKFWNNHVRTYRKKPIYWLFSSKDGAFQALIYMQRMNQFTVEKLRDKYLLKHIQFLEQDIARMESNMSSLTRAEQKTLDQLRSDLQECNEYDLLLKDFATKQLKFDLDDGVTHNYELFKGVVAPIK